MVKRKILFIAIAPLLLLLGMMLSFRILSQLPSPEVDGIPVNSEVHQPAPLMRPADATLQKALESPVRGQLSAIRKGDYTAAITFSAPSFRNSWNPKRFTRCHLLSHYWHEEGWQVKPARSGRRASP